VKGETLRIVDSEMKETQFPLNLVFSPMENDKYHPAICNKFTIFGTMQNLDTSSKICHLCIWDRFHEMVSVLRRCSQMSKWDIVLLSYDNLFKQ
jgi:hypothetical protein